MTASRRTLAIVLVTALASAAIAVTAMLALDSDSPSATQDSESTSTTTTSATPSPEDQYIDALEGSSHFATSLDGRLRQLRIIDGRDACDLLRSNNGDIVDARISMISKLADFSAEGEGMAEEGLAEKTAFVVEAASRYLCPGVAAT